MDYVTGYVSNGQVWYRNEHNNYVLDIKQAKVVTQKQGHHWFWKMRQNGPNTAWGYWPVQTIKIGKTKVAQRTL